MNNFWLKLKPPITVLAPMADVTDAAFRRIIAKLGKPDVFLTEFVSADGLFKRPSQKTSQAFTQAVYNDYNHLLTASSQAGVAPDNPLLLDLLYTEAERPIVAQIFTSQPKLMEQGAALIEALGFDGLDINMGCPDRSVERQGCGAALIKNPHLAKTLIQAAKIGAPNLPISVKTRAGYRHDEVDTWLPELLAAEPAVITLHARTRQEMSKVPADWHKVKRAVEIRNRLNSPTLIIGNGDIHTPAEGRDRANEVGADGAMIGRGIFGCPWLWSGYEPTIKDKLEVMVKQTKLFTELFAGHKNLAVMKKHFKAYVAGWDGAKSLRAKLMAAESIEAIEAIVADYMAKL